MASTISINFAAFEKALEEQKKNVKTEGDAQIEKMAALKVQQQSHPAAFLSGILGAVKPEGSALAEVKKEEPLAVPEVTHEEFAKAMGAMRLHYTAGAPGANVELFRLPEHMAKLPIVLSAAKPAGIAPATRFVALTKEGTDATSQLLLQCHKEMIAAIQSHTGAVLDTLKTYTQSQNLAAFKTQMEATRAAWKAKVNAIIDKTINQALAIGQKHSDQHSALASVTNKIGQLFGSISHTVEGAVQGAVHTVSSAAKDVGGAVVTAAKDVGHAASSVVHSIGHFFGL